MKQRLLVIVFSISLLSAAGAWTPPTVSAVLLESQEQILSASDEDLPFDNNTFLGKVFNWAARLFLWFIYLTLFFIAIAITQWFLTARSFWSWIVCAAGVFFYGMLLGRYWGYGACLIFFAVIFTSLKIYLSLVPESQKGKWRTYFFSKWNPFQKEKTKNLMDQPNQEIGNYNREENS